MNWAGFKSLGPAPSNSTANNIGKRRTGEATCASSPKPDLVVSSGKMKTCNLINWRDHQLRFLPTQLQGGRGVEEFHQLWSEPPAAAEPSGNPGFGMDRQPASPGNSGLCPSRTGGRKAASLFPFERAGMTRHDAEDGFAPSPRLADR